MEQAEAEGCAGADVGWGCHVNTPMTKEVVASYCVSHIYRLCVGSFFWLLLWYFAADVMIFYTSASLHVH